MGNVEDIGHEIGNWLEQQGYAVPNEAELGRIARDAVARADAANEDFILRRPSGLSDQEWRDVVGYARVRTAVATTRLRNDDAN